MADRIVPLTWYGSKASQLNKILPCLPQMPKYVEPFGGSGVVLMNRPIASIEVYNDIYGDVVHFFRTLRDKSDELITAITLTPWSRQDFIESLKVVSSDSDIERARKFYVRIGQSFSGLGKTEGNWSRSKTVRVGMPSSVRTYLRRVNGLPEVVERLRAVQIENKDALEVFRFFDSEDTLTYCDPPYVASSRTGNAYKHETTDDYHSALLAALTKAKGKVAISGYRNELYESLLSEWHLYTWDVSASSNIGRVEREECLWANYDVSYMVLNLFGIEKIR